MDLHNEPVGKRGDEGGVAFAAIAGLIVITALAVVWRVGAEFLERWGELSRSW